MPQPLEGCRSWQVLEKKILQNLFLFRHESYTSDQWISIFFNKIFENEMCQIWSNI
jgi:hypothetical protein